MRVTLLTSGVPTSIGFVAGVHVGVLLPVRTVGEATVTTLEFTPERLLAWENKYRIFLKHTAL